MQLFTMALASVGLYGFGMSLNDIIDRRRDTQLAAHRPLPSGRMNIVAAHAVCVLFGLLAAWGGAAYAHETHPTGWMSFMLVVACGLFITFYDFAGKYLVGLGLLSLGMIRFLHAAVAAPWLPVPWHPLLLLNHVAILSTLAYHWEEKRPPLTRAHWWTVLGGLGGVNLLVLASIGWRRGDQTLKGAIHALDLQPGLLLPLAAVALFVAFGYVVRRRNPIARDAGQKLMLYGLLWLIVYDAAFVAGYVSWIAGGIILALLPIAWWSVVFMRWWSKLISVAQRPTFQRART
jgi:hypothetical protein